MSWTSSMRSNRFPNAFNRQGKYRSGTMSNHKFQHKTFEPRDDTKNRRNVVEEIDKRYQNGEKIDDIVSDIASRKEIQEQFDYYKKNGIANLEEIFKNWYNSYNKSKDNPNKIHLR